MTDPIADYLTRLRNAISAKHRVVEVPASNLKNKKNYQLAFLTPGINPLEAISRN